MTYNGKEYFSIDEIKAVADANKLVAVKSIEARGSKLYVAIIDNPIVSNDMSADWVKEHIEMYGVEPSLF